MSVYTHTQFTLVRRVLLLDNHSANPDRARYVYSLRSRNGPAESDGTLSCPNMHLP